MDRRSFLKTLAAGAVAAATDGLNLLAEARGKRTVASLKNWAWIPFNTEKSVDDWKRSFAHLRESGIHAIVPEIYNGKEAYFASSHLPVKTDLLGRMLPLALQAGLEVHAWMWV